MKYGFEPKVRVLSFHCALLCGLLDRQTLYRLPPGVSTDPFIDVPTGIYDDLALMRRVNSMQLFLWFQK